MNKRTHQIGHQQQSLGAVMPLAPRERNGALGQCFLVSRRCGWAKAREVGCTQLITLPTTARGVVQATLFICACCVLRNVRDREIENVVRESEVGFALYQEHMKSALLSRHRHGSVLVDPSPQRSVMRSPPVRSATRLDDTSWTALQCMRRRSISGLERSTCGFPPFWSEMWLAAAARRSPPPL